MYTKIERNIHTQVIEMAYIAVNQVDEIIKMLLPCDTVVADNRTDFTERIKTFFNNQEKHWLLKPASLSPAACSRFGWKCIDNDMLCCVTCSATLCVKLPHIWNSLAYDRCEKETVKSLCSAHRKHCPWSLAPSPECFVQMEPVHKGQAYQEFVNRLESLLQLKDNLPAIKEEVIGTLGLSDATFNAFCRLTRIPNDKISRSALAMACTGWIRSPPSEKKCVVCFNCHRTVNLSFFVPAGCTPQPEKLDVTHFGDHSSTELISDCDSTVNLEQKDSNKNNDNPKPSKRIRMINEPLQYFDSLYEHRHWCLWVTPGRTKESATESTCKDEEKDKIKLNHDLNSKPGWRIFLTCLLRNLDGALGDSPSPSKPTPEKLRKIRQMLESWNQTPDKEACTES